MQVTNLCDVERLPNKVGTNPKVRAMSLGITKLSFQVMMKWMIKFAPMIAYVAHGVIIGLRFVVIGNIVFHQEFHSPNQNTSLCCDVPLAIAVDCALAAGVSEV